MLAELEEEMPVDGVFLALHGAMAVRDVPRPEAEIARRFRELVGPDVPIAATFDLHGNEDAEFLAHADFSLVTKRFPHYDSYIQGERAARALRLAAKGEYVPTTATRKPGIITATVLQWTGQSPAMDIMERARRWEAREHDAYVSVFFGYPWSDVPDVGATIQVMTNGDQALADEHRRRHGRLHVARARGLRARQLPPPHRSRPNRRGSHLTRRDPRRGRRLQRPPRRRHPHPERLRRRPASASVLYGTITSPATLEALAAANAQPGDPFDHEIGGFTPSGGSPHRVTGTLEYFGEGFGYDRIAAVAFGDGNVVFLTPAYEQVLYPDAFRFGPIDPADYDVFVVKSRVHFRRGFDETGYARTILVVEAPGPFVGTTFLDALPYENVDLSEHVPVRGAGWPTVSQKRFRETRSCRRQHPRSTFSVLETHSKVIAMPVQTRCAEASPAWRHVRPGKSLPRVLFGAMVLPAAVAWVIACEGPAEPVEPADHVNLVAQGSARRWWRYMRQQTGTTGSSRGVRDGCPMRLSETGTAYLSARTAGLRLWTSVKAG